MIAIGVTLALIFAFVVVWGVYGGTTASLWLFLITVCAVSAQVFSIGPQLTTLQTIAKPTIGLTTYQVALLLAIIAVPGWKVLRKTNPWLLALPVLLLCIAAIQNSLFPQVVSGIFQFLFLALAWGFGSSIADQLKRGLISENRIAWAIASMIAIQGFVVLLQAAGVMSVDATAVGSESVSRLNGLTSHSGQLGKLLLLLLVMILPFTQSTSRAARRLTYLSVLGVTVIVALTYSRANMLALGVILGIWFVAGTRGNLIKRLAVPTIALLAVLPAIGTLLLRQEFDEDGGSRPLLLQSALHQISQTFWWGTGPNNYLPVVSQFDRLAAGGLPVHNSALLLLAELGIVAFILLAIPIVLLLLRGLTVARGKERGRSTAIVLLAATPGFALIIATGHGLTASDMFPLFLFVCGYCWENMLPTRDPRRLSPVIQRSLSRTS